MDYSIFESDICSKVETLLNSFKEKFTNKKITYTIELKKSSPTEEVYNSEIEINFFRDGNFFDVIEFFIYHHGEVFVKEENLIDELSSDFEGIVASV